MIISYSDISVGYINHRQLQGRCITQNSFAMNGDRAESLRPASSTRRSPPNVCTCRRRLEWIYAGCIYAFDSDMRVTAGPLIIGAAVKWLWVASVSSSHDVTSRAVKISRRASVCQQSAAACRLTIDEIKVSHDLAMIDNTCPPTPSLPVRWARDAPLSRLLSRRR